jgi:nucleotide-binding universal stress UspA family protein
MVVEAPSISEEIAKLVESQSCDLLVLGHRKHHVLAGDLGEGTLKKVLKLATVPVMIVPAPKTKA